MSGKLSEASAFGERRRNFLQEAMSVEQAKQQLLTILEQKL
jgi:hypothetical protein